MSYFSFQFGFEGHSLAFGDAIAVLWRGNGDREGMQQLNICTVWIAIAVSDKFNVAEHIFWVYPFPN